METKICFFTAAVPLVFKGLSVQQDQNAGNSALTEKFAPLQSANRLDEHKVIG